MGSTRFFSPVRMPKASSDILDRPPVGSFSGPSMVSQSFARIGRSAVLSKDSPNLL